MRIASCAVMSILPGFINYAHKSCLKTDFVPATRVEFVQAPLVQLVHWAQGACASTAVKLAAAAAPDADQLTTQSSPQIVTHGNVLLLLSLLGRSASLMWIRSYFAVFTPTSSPLLSAHGSVPRSTPGEAQSSGKMVTRIRRPAAKAARKGAKKLSTE